MEKPSLLTSLDNRDIFALLREELCYCNENIQTSQQHVFKALALFYIPIVTLLAYALWIKLGNRNHGSSIVPIAGIVILSFLTCMLLLNSYIIHMQRGWSVYRIKLEQEIAKFTGENAIPVTLFYSDFNRSFFFGYKPKRWSWLIHMLPVHGFGIGFSTIILAIPYIITRYVLIPAEISGDFLFNSPYETGLFVFANLAQLSFWMSYCILAIVIYHHPSYHKHLKVFDDCITSRISRP